MASYYTSITDEQVKLIEASKLFFVATAAPTVSDVTSDKVGPINVSPKGGVPLHIVDRNHVAYLDYAGSGNETAQHLKAGSPITVMICSFDENAAIVRLYGTGTVTAIEASPLGEQLLESDCKTTGQPPRQVIDVFVEKTATSCGYGVPIMEFGHHRRKVEHGRKYKT